MAGTARVRNAGGGVFDAVGAFLAQHALSADPVHYAFVHDILADPGSATARAVAQLTDCGVRLTAEDIANLGGGVARSTAPHVSIDQANARLAAETHAQVEEFAGLVRTMRDEARGFGRDLADSTAAMTHLPSGAKDELQRIAQTMAARLRNTEQRLALATAEADELRTKLADARDTARRDVLTGLPNRLAFDEALGDRMGGDDTLCIALCDVDRFKSVNDLHGHGVGDRVLCAIGKALATACEGHLVARYGGEEFVVLTRGLDLADAARLMDRARADIAVKRFRLRDTDVPLGRMTLSAGVVAIQIGETAREAIARADALLYVAKENGRDAVCAG